MNTYQDANAAVIDRWITEGWEWGKPVDHETYLQAQNGQWSVCNKSEVLRGKPLGGSLKIGGGIGGLNGHI